MKSCQPFLPIPKSYFAKILFLPSFAVAIMGFLSFVSPVFAQTNAPAYQQVQQVPADESYDTFLRNIQQSNQTGQINTDSLYGSVILNRTLMGVTRLLLGDAATNDVSLKTNSNGLIGFATGAVGSVYGNPPASGIQYTADLLQGAHIIAPTYAQANNAPAGNTTVTNDPAAVNQQGFQRIGGLEQLWAAMRDLAYFLYIPIFIYIGIMIMFRQSIGGKSPASIQSALPRIALSLILVTFSFAIVGFMIDLMNLSMALIVGYLQVKGLIAGVVADPSTGNHGIFAYLYNQNLFSMAFDKNKLNVISFVNAPSQALDNIIKNLIQNTGVKFLSSLLGDTAKLLAEVILSLALVFVIFQTFLTLIKAYISILVMTILGPIMIAFSAVPGSHTAGSWFRNILANLAVFPAVLAIILFAGIIGNVASITGGGNNQNTNAATSTTTISGWQPPFMNINDAGLVNDFTGFISFGTLLMLPTLLKQLQKFFSAEGTSTYFAPVSDSMNILKNYATRPFKKRPEYERERKQREERERAPESQASVTV